MPLTPEQELEYLKLKKQKSLYFQQSEDFNQNQQLDDNKTATISSEPDTSNQLAFGAQASGRGLADTFGFPVDLATMGINAASSLANKFPGINIPQIEKPIGGSDSIADIFGNAAKEAGYPIVNPEELKGTDKYKYNAIRFGTGAAGGGLGAASRVSKISNEVSNLTRGQKLEKAITEPYLQNTGRQVVDDTLAGIGAGAGYTGAEELFPDSPLAQLTGTILGGGVTSVGTRGIENAGKSIIKKTAQTTNSFTGLPIGELSSNSTLPDGSIEPRQTINDASLIFKMIASDPQKASANIKNMNQMAEEGNMTRLTPGVASDDVGLGAAEVRLRTQNPRAYQERDQKIRTEISKQMNDLADPEADVTVPQTFAQNEINSQVGDAELKANQAHKKVADEKQNLFGVDRETENLIEPYISQRGRKNEASKILDKQIGTEGALGERTKIKNQKFEDAAGDEVADVSPIANSLKKVEKEINELGFENTGIPADFVKKIRAALPEQNTEEKLNQTNLEYLNKIESAGKNEPTKKVRDTAEEYALFKTVFEQAKKDGALEDLAKTENKDPVKYAAEIEENLNLRKQKLDKLKSPKSEEIQSDKSNAYLGFAPKKEEPKQIKLKDVARVRRDIGSAISRARGAGNYDLADNLSTLKSDINGYIDRLAPFDDAQKYYREEYAPFFAEGYGKKFRDTVHRADERTGSADPGKIADIFLSGTADAARDLKKIVDIAPNTEEAHNAVRNYLAADLATRIGDKASPRVIANWIKNRSSQINEFPEIKKEFENFQRKIGSQEQKKDELQQLITQLNNEATQSERNIGQTRSRLEKGVLGTITNKDPDRYVKSIMSSDNRLQQLDEVNKLIGNNQEAKRGFKRAVVDHILKETEGSNIKLTDNKEGPIQYAQIKKLMDNNQDALAKIMSPDEMNTIRRAQKWLGQYGNLSRRSTTGSPTAEYQNQTINSNKNNLWATFNAGLRIKYGVLKAGGIMKTIKDIAPFIPYYGKRAEKVDKLIERAMFDPELATHLLDAPIKEVNTVRWNKRLTQLLGISSAVRETSDDEEN